jgi:hypothetical protein
MGLAQSLRVTPAALDFGDVAPGASLERVVSISNVADRDIRLAGCGSACACLTCTVSGPLLPAGSRSDWLIRLDVCPDQSGDACRQVWLRSDAPGCAAIRLPVRYRVVPAVFCEPQLVSLGVLDGGPIECEVEIRTVLEEPLALADVGCDDPRIELDLLDDRVSLGDPARLVVRALGPWPEGRLRATVRVETASPAVPVLRVPVFGEVISGLRSDQPEVNFQSVPLGRSAQRDLELTCTDGVMVVDARTTSSSVEVAHFRRRAHGTIVTLRSDAHLGLGSFRGFVTIEVNTGGHNRILRLPYRGRVISAGVHAAPEQE